MGGIMVDDTPIILINQTYYNFVGPHMGLDGMTPAEVAGIRMNEIDKWVCLLKAGIAKRISWTELGKDKLFLIS